jgi:hypothetical protein
VKKCAATGNTWELGEYIESSIEDLVGTRWEHGEKIEKIK